MSITTTRWDSAEHLKTEEDIQLYLEACMEDAGDDPAFVVHALGVVARARNMSQLARDTGMSREGLYFDRSQYAIEYPSPQPSPAGRKS